MQFNKIKAPMLYLDEEQYIFNDFNFGFVNFKYACFKSNFKDKIAFKNIKLYEKKGEFYIENFKPYCSCYNSRNVISKGFTKRKLILLGVGEIIVNVKRYKCKSCGKYFQTDLTGLVDKNFNISIVLKEKIIKLYGFFKGSLHKIRECLKEEHNVNISHQSIENILLSEKITKKEEYLHESGYYLFDVQYIKINCKWKYRYVLFDSKLNIPIIEELKDNQKFETTKDFLEENLKYRHIKSITTDNHPHYKKILRKLKYNHQLCIFHTKQEINRKIKQYINKNTLHKSEIKKLQEEKRLIFDIFNSTTIQDARNKLNNIIIKKEELSEFILKNIVIKLRNYFKNYVLFMKNPHIECTSNKIENYFSKTMPKSIKKKFKSKNGVLSRIATQSKIWVKRNQKTI